MVKRLSKEEARQGETSGVVRYVLVISTVVAIIAVAIVWAVIA